MDSFSGQRRAGKIAARRSILCMRRNNPAPRLRPSTEASETAGHRRNAARRQQPRDCDIGCRSAMHNAPRAGRPHIRPCHGLPRSLHMHNDIPGAPRWYYEDNGERRGSLDEAQMIELIRAGRLDRHTPVWKIGSADWQLLDDSELRSHLDSPVPPASSDRDVANRLIWLLACAPLLGYL